MLAILITSTTLISIEIAIFHVSVKGDTIGFIICKFLHVYMHCINNFIIQVEIKYPLYYTYDKTACYKMTIVEYTTFCSKMMGMGR